MNWQLVLLGSAITVFATSLGALLALALRYLSVRAYSILTSLSASVMLSASSFSLIQLEEIIHEIQGKQASSEALGERLTGFVLMLILDIALNGYKEVLCIF
jgi:zinc transporter ZupT